MKERRASRTCHSASSNRNAVLSRGANREIGHSDWPSARQAACSGVAGESKGPQLPFSAICKTTFVPLSIGYSSVAPLARLAPAKRKHADSPCLQDRRNDA